MSDIITSELILSKNNGYVYHVSNKLLGKGSYGNVFVGYVDNTSGSRKVAIKCCKNDENGITNILEACLMKTLLHPTINNAIEILCTEHKLYIIQELAQMDLYTYTNINKNNHLCTMSELNYIFFSLVQGIKILHSEQLIHCDIKASNVLLFPNNVIKLTDFTLTVRQNSTPLAYTVCTPTHRPLECHMRQSWSYALDMWSLGCTFYEIAFNDVLFPNQSFVDKKAMSKKSYKHLIHQRYVNAILEWGQKQGQTLPISFYPVDHEPIYVNERINIKNDVNKLILSLLQLDSKLRPTIHDVFALPFFTDNTATDPTLIEPIQNTLLLAEEARVIRYIEQCTNKNELRKLAYKLYTQLTLPTMSEYFKAIGVTWVASKMIDGHVDNVNKLIDIEEILVIEREIVQDLHFRCYF